MLIPGVPDEHLAMQHWNDGGGHGTLGYRHLPSGISVSRLCPPTVRLSVINAELLAELAERLRAEGWGAGQNDPIDPSPNGDSGPRRVGRGEHRPR